MFGGSGQPAERGSSALITGLTLLALGAMAAAIPPARLAPGVAGVERGFVVSAASYSDMMAEFLNGKGYTFMAIDFTEVPLRGGDIWRIQFDAASRIFPVWGWVDVRGGTEQAKKVAAGLPLSGLYLYGATPEDADRVRAANPGLRVVPVVRPGDTWKGKGAAAAAFRTEGFAEARKAQLPVLLVERLSDAERAAARATLTGDYVICSVPILD